MAMIFTAAQQFDKDTIQSIRILKSHYSDITCFEYKARMVVRTFGQDMIFEGDEALEVIDQLRESGFYSHDQYKKVHSLMHSYQLADIKLG